MADPTNPGQPSDDASSRGRPVNVNEARVENVRVTRMDVATGEIKELQADLLDSLKKSVDAQTATLASILKDTKKDMVDAIKNGGGGGSGGGSGKSGGTGGSGSGKGRDDKIVDLLESLISKETGEGGGGDFASAKAAQRVWGLVEEAAKQTERTGLPAFKEFFGLFQGGVMTQFKRNMVSINQSVVSFGESISDLQSAIRKTTDSISKIFDAGQGGLVDVTSLVTDLGAGLFRGRDALSSTVPVIMEFAEANRMLIGTMGSTATELAETFKRNRQIIDEQFGDDGLGRLPFEDQNVILTQILDQQRRAGVMATNEEILRSDTTQKQLDFLNQIAFATGKTVKEVMKLQEKDAMTLEELRFNGLISKEQMEIMKRQGAFFDLNELEQLPDFMQRLIELGGIDFAKRELAFLMNQGNNEAVLREMLDTFRNDDSATGQARVLELAAQLKGLEGMTKEQISVFRELFPDIKGLAAIQVNAQKFIGTATADGTKTVAEAIQAARDAADEAKEGIGATVQEAFQTARDFIKNNLGEGGALALAIGANVAALVANTVALGGSGLLRGMGNVFKKVPGLGGLFKGGGLSKADELLKNSVLRKATTSAGAGARGAGMAGRAGALISTAAAGIIGVAIAGAVGYALGTMLSKGIDWMIQKFTGDPNASLGTTDAAASVFGGIESVLGISHVDPELKAKTDADVQRRLAEAEERKVALAELNEKRQAQGLDALTMSQFRAQGVSPHKGVSPQTPRDPAAVAPSEVAQGPQMMVLTSEAAATELGRQTEHLTRIVELLTTANGQRLDMLGKISAGGGGMETTGKHSAPGRTINRNGPPAPYSPLLDEGGMSTPDAYT